MMVPTLLGPIHVDDQGAAGQPIALLWPSLFTDHTMWRHQVMALRAAGWRTLALDPPTHGRSPGPNRRFTMEECAQATVQVLDARSVTTPVVALGTSWGGFVALRMALIAPDRIRALVLFNTSADAPQLSQRAKATVLTLLMPFAVLDSMVDRINLSTLLFTKAGKQDKATGADIVRRYRSWNRQTLIQCVRSVLLERTSVVDALSEIVVPTLVVSDKQDTILPTAFGRRIAARLQHSRFLEVSEAAHLIPLEQPAIANRLIGEFFQHFSI